MIRTYCDICKQESQIKKITITIGRSADGKLIREKKDLCQTCIENLTRFKEDAEMYFVNQEGKVENEFNKGN